MTIPPNESTSSLCCCSDIYKIQTKLEYNVHLKLPPKSSSQIDARKSHSNISHDTMYWHVTLLVFVLVYAFVCHPCCGNLISKSDPRNQQMPTTTTPLVQSQDPTKSMESCRPACVVMEPRLDTKYKFVSFPFRRHNTEIIPTAYNRAWQQKHINHPFISKHFVCCAKRLSAFGSALSEQCFTMFTAKSSSEKFLLISLMRACGLYSCLRIVMTGRCTDQCLTLMKVSWSGELGPAEPGIDWSWVWSPMIPKHRILYRKTKISQLQSCKMSQIWQIYLCKNIEKLG